MRIIAGEYRGRRLVAPRGLATRPTSDKVREAVFNILGSALHHPFRALDLYAGTGALGLEAISRGADEAVLVDEDRGAVDAAERNVVALGLGARVRVLRREVGAALRDLDGRGETFDWIFVDPPYEGGALDRALRLLGDGRRLAPGGVIVAEHDAENAPGETFGRLRRDDLRRWGRVAVSFYSVAPEVPE